jgi:hypothetical protein
MAAEAGIRLDYLSRIIDAIKSDKELESILGSPVEQHVVLLVEGGHFRFNSLTPFGENERQYTEVDKARAAEIVGGIIRAHYPGTENLPGVR